jgi:hypothetical protein
MTSQPPPPYTKPDHNLAFANSQEERRALEEWAESKKYVKPGRDGTLSAMDRGGYGLLSLVWGGPMETGPPIPESPTERLAALEKLDAAKRKEEERRMNRKPSLREKVKKLVKGKQQEEAALR